MQQCVFSVTVSGNVSYSTYYQMFVSHSQSKVNAVHISVPVRNTDYSLSTVHGSIFSEDRLTTSVDFPDSMHSMWCLNELSDLRRDRK